jgi:hypothetical protein
MRNDGTIRRRKVRNVKKTLQCIVFFPSSGIYDHKLVVNSATVPRKTLAAPLALVTPKRTGTTQSRPGAPPHETTSDRCFSAENPWIFCQGI